MDGRNIEPREVLWAVAEVTWQDGSGTSFRAPATLVDTSPSGACVRVKRPFSVGSRVTIKWHRDIFSAVTRNCRKDGWEFLLGVRREPAEPHVKDREPVAAPAEIQPAPAPPAPAPSSAVVRPQQQRARPDSDHHASGRDSSGTSALPDREVTLKPRPGNAQSFEKQSRLPSPGPSPRAERKVMPSKTFFPHFWRRPNDGDAPAKSISTEAPMNKPSTEGNTPSGPRGELLSYEDIYRAAGMISTGSGYGIHKVVEMMNSERIRDLSQDVKRASVLMALDAAGISADEMLTDATRRQNALNAYEAGQRKQLEEFEARKAQENAKVEEEMEKIRVHYAERIQQNLDQVAKEKESLRNWQMAMQHESRRITDVMELCTKQPVPQPASSLAAAAGAHGTSGKPEGHPAESARKAAQPILSSGS